MTGGLVEAALGGSVVSGAAYECRIVGSLAVVGEGVDCVLANGLNAELGGLDDVLAHPFDDEDEREAEATIRRCVYLWLRDIWRKTRTEETRRDTLQNRKTSTNMSTNTSMVTEVVPCRP